MGIAGLSPVTSASMERTECRKRTSLYWRNCAQWSSFSSAIPPFHFVPGLHPPLLLFSSPLIGKQRSGVKLYRAWSTSIWEFSEFVKNYQMKIYSLLMKKATRDYRNFLLWSPLSKYQLFVIHFIIVFRYWKILWIFREKPTQYFHTFSSWNLYFFLDLFLYFHFGVQTQILSGYMHEITAIW